MYVKDNQTLFQSNENIHNKNTRNKTDMRYERRKLEMSRRTALCMGPILYNPLPNKIKNLKNQERFKKEVKDYLILHCFYSVDEYVNLNECECKYCVTETKNV